MNDIVKNVKRELIPSNLPMLKSTVAIILDDLNNLQNLENIKTELMKIVRIKSIKQINVEFQQNSFKRYKIILFDDLSISKVLNHLESFRNLDIYTIENNHKQLKYNSLKRKRYIDQNINYQIDVDKIRHQNLIIYNSIIDFELILQSLKKNILHFQKYDNSFKFSIQNQTINKEWIENEFSASKDTFYLRKLKQDRNINEIQLYYPENSINIPESNLKSILIEQNYFKYVNNIKYTGEIREKSIIIQFTDHKQSQNFINEFFYNDFNKSKRSLLFNPNIQMLQQDNYSESDTRKQRLIKTKKGLLGSHPSHNIQYKINQIDQFPNIHNGTFTKLQGYDFHKNETENLSMVTNTLNIIPVNQILLFQYKSIQMEDCLNIIQTLKSKVTEDTIGYNFALINFANVITQNFENIIELRIKQKSDQNNIRLYFFNIFSLNVEKQEIKSKSDLLVRSLQLIPIKDILRRKINNIQLAFDVPNILNCEQQDRDENFQNLNNFLLINQKCLLVDSNTESQNHYLFIPRCDFKKLIIFFNNTIQLNYEKLIALIENKNEILSLNKFKDLMLKESLLILECSQTSDIPYYYKAFKDSQLKQSDDDIQFKEFQDISNFKKLFDQPEIDPMTQNWHGEQNYKVRQKF